MFSLLLLFLFIVEFAQIFPSKMANFLQKIASRSFRKQKQPQSAVQLPAAQWLDILAFLPPPRLASFHPLKQQLGLLGRNSFSPPPPLSPANAGFSRPGKLCQPSPPNPILGCALACLLFDLASMLFCLSVALQMLRIVPSLAPHLLAFSFCAPFLLIYGSLLLAFLYDSCRISRSELC